MALPLSTKWDRIDYSFRADAGTEGYTGGSRPFSDVEHHLSGEAFIQFSNVVVDDGFVYLNALCSAKTSAVKQTSSVIVSSEITGGIPENFTIEFDIYLQDEALPKSFSDVENRLFVGAINIQGYAAGFLFSTDGIALASHPEDPAPTILGGSKDLIFNADGSVNDGLFIRAIVDGENGRLAIYTSPSDTAYLTKTSEETEAQLVYSVAAKKAGGSHNDSVIFHASSKSAAQQLFEKPSLESAEGQDSAFALGSFRLSGAKVLPVDRPVSSVSGDLQTVVGGAVQLFGAKSFDKEGRSLEYTWEVELAPKGSKVKMQGARHARAVLSREEEDGSTLELVTLTFESPTSKYNDYTAEVTVGEPNSLLSMTLDHEAEKLLIVLGADSDGEANVTGAMLVSAFFNSKSAGHNFEISGGEIYEYDPDSDSGKKIARVYDREIRASLTIPESSGLDLIVPGTYAFSGGAGSSLMNPLLIPDRVGQYVVSLTVNNGVRDSEPTKHALSATLTKQLLGHRPNSEYIFKYLPDFWNLVKDKEHLSALWSSMTQVISSEMMSLWQNDYAKALKDIARKYQRRWLHHDDYEEIPVDEPMTLITQESLTADNLSITYLQGGTHTSVATSSASSVDTPLSEGLAIVYSDAGPPEVAEVVASVYDADLSLWDITFATASLPVYKLIDDRTGGYFVRDMDDITPTTPLVSTVLYDPTYAFSLISDDEHIRLVHVDGTEEVVQITARDIGGVNNTVRLNLSSEQPVDGVARNWEHIRSVGNVKVVQRPYLQVSSLTTLTQDYTVGDYLIIEVSDPYTNGSVDVPLSIIAFREGSLFVEWKDLLSALDATALLHGVVRTWTEDDLSELSLRVKSLHTHDRMAKKENLVHVPALGTDTVTNVGVYKEYLDFEVVDEAIRLDPLISGKCTVRENRIQVEPGFVAHPLINEFVNSVGIADAEGAIGGGLSVINLGAGPAGSYRVMGYDSVTQEIIIDCPVLEEISGIPFHAPRTSAHYPGPGRYWAEVSYFDNSEVVENNFGLYVGFPKSLIDEYDPTLDYLAVIKSMWFAMMSGPHFDNLKLAVQALFNLPYTEQAGRVLYAKEANSVEEGRLIFMDDDDREHVYALPEGTSLAVNPRTGRTIKGFPFTDDLESLTDEQILDREDSLLDPYVKLVDVIKIDDYISDPDLISKQFGGDSFEYVDDEGIVHAVDKSPTIIEKYHTFLVNVPLEVTHSTAVFPLVKKFLEAAKPAYTNFILVGSLNFVDEVNVLEEAILKPTILLKDTPHTSPFFARYDGRGLSYTAVLPLLDSGGEVVIDTETGLPKYQEQTVQQALVTAAREAKLWPERKSLERVAVIDETPLDGMVKLTGRYQRVSSGIAGFEYYRDDVNVHPLPPFDYKHTDKGTADDPSDENYSLQETYEGSDWDHAITFHKEDLPVEFFTEGFGYVAYNPDIPSSVWYPTELGHALLGTPQGSDFSDSYTGTSFKVRFVVRIRNSPHFIKVVAAANIFSEYDSYLLDEDGVTRIYPLNTLKLTLKAAVDATYTLEAGEGLLGSLIPFYDATDEGTLLDVFVHVGDRDNDGYHDAFDSSGIQKTCEELPDPIITYWDLTDVYEKYESGYCEGVLDDWSGDGSWNYQRKVVDMVNSWNSDIDVVMSKLWLPVQKEDTAHESDPGSPYSSPEFIRGEPLDVKYYIDGVGGDLSSVEGFIWNDSPPVIEHIGSGSHPKIPFNTISPQNQHPLTYLILGFEATYDSSKESLELVQEDPALVNNYGNEERLNWWDSLKAALVELGAIAEGDNLIDTRIKFIGRESGAQAYLTTHRIVGFADQFSIDDEATKGFYDLQTIWQQDKLIENGPASDPDFIITKYVPIGGIKINDFRASSYCFTPGGGWDDDPSKPPGYTPDLPFSDKTYTLWSYSDHDDDGLITGVDAELVHHTGAEITSKQASRYNLEVQCLPPDLSLSNDAQMVPSVSPGFYSWWNNVPVPTPVDGTASGITPASTVEPLLVWGYADQGELESGVNTVAEQDWEPPATATALQNIHIGMKVKSRKTRHLTHGFTEFYIPPPTIKMIVPSSSAYDIRVCGFYFCADDPTRTTVPTDTEFDGTIGGSWVFMRNCVTGEEIQVTDWHFETGIHPGKHIVPKGPTRAGVSTWVVGREADVADSHDNGQTSDGHIIEFNVPTIGEEGYYDIIIRNYRPWYLSADTSEDKRNVHIDTVIASRAYYYSTEGFGGTAWGTSSWGSAE